MCPQSLICGQCPTSPFTHKCLVGVWIKVGKQILGQFAVAPLRLSHLTTRGPSLQELLSCSLSPSLSLCALSLFLSVLSVLSLCLSLLFLTKEPPFLLYMHVILGE